MSKIPPSLRTLVISDLHLTEEQPIIKNRPFWKKYKTREFFFDKNLKKFLDSLQTDSHHNSIELILNGDIFDFDSVMTLPDHPPFRISWIEKKRGLFPEEDKSEFKIKKILSDHPLFIEALKAFIEKGNHVVLIIGNHDVELHFLKVQMAILKALNLKEEDQKRFKVCEFFYISGNDTYIEHGNQYDPFCVLETPIRPFILKNGRIRARIPFGNLATRYLINGMGYFNPYSESNFIMSMGQYVKFFLKYMVRTQPLLVITWLWSSFVVLKNSLQNGLKSSINDPLTYETEIENIAKKANGTPRMVREMLQLAVSPATSSPWLIAKELWLDRAFFFLLGFIVLVQLFFIFDQLYDISFYWVLILYLIYLPFFVFYSRTIISDVKKYKEPREKILTLTSLITGTKRVVYGHTHTPLHEIIGPVEHLNSGTWSPNFKDVECTIQNTQRSYVDIYYDPHQKTRVAKLKVWT